MTRDRSHSHPCQHCGTPVECYGDQELNRDGFPSVICTSYHLANGTIAHVLCEGCDEKEAQQMRTDIAENV